MTPTNKELIEKFRNRFGNYSLYENQGYMGYKDVMPEVEAFLLSQAQELNEKHEADIRALREAMITNFNKNTIKIAGNKISDLCDRADVARWMTDAFDHTLSILRSNDKE